MTMVGLHGTSVSGRHQVTVEMAEWNPHAQCQRDSRQSVGCGILGPVLQISPAAPPRPREACNLGSHC